MKKLSTLTFFAIFTFVLLAFTFGVFESRILRGTAIQIAAWSVKINDGIVSSETKTFTISDITWDSASNVVPGKVAPGIEGYFDMVIDPNNTDVSVRYDITYDISHLQNINPAFTLIGVVELDNNDIVVTNNTYTGLILLDDIRNNVTHTVRTYVKWEDIEGNEANDYKTGYEQLNFELPVSVVVSQYLGEELEGIVVDPQPLQGLRTVFAYNGPCIFNGSASTITGSNCQSYSSSNLINTNVKLFDRTNYSKDFVITFTLSDYVANQQEVGQATVMNAFKERSPLGYGTLIRRSNTQLQLLFRDGNGAEKTLRITPSSTTTFKIIRSNKTICYSINNGNLIYALDYSDFDEPFDVPVTFGGSIDSSGNPFRYIKGTISNMSIQTGTITDPTLICPTS